jgi:hypothetical protein
VLQSAQSSAQRLGWRSYEGRSNRFNLRAVNDLAARRPFRVSLHAVNRLGGRAAGELGGPTSECLVCFELFGNKEWKSFECLAGRDLRQPTRIYVVDEAPHRDALRYPWV